MPEKILAVVRSAEPDHRRDVEGWDVRQVVLCRQDPVEVSSEVLERALEGVQALAVTSPRAAVWLDDRPEAILRGFPVLTAGERTASFLVGWNTFVPATGVGGRAVADLAGAEGIQKLLFVGASETAGTLEEACRAAGIECRHLAVYKTEIVSKVPEEDLQALREAHACAFLAPSAVDALVRLRPDVVLSLASKPAAASGIRTLESLRRWGWKDVREAQGPSLEELAAACDGPAAIGE
ncbi:MAG TPA: uroporphyrinogen-III synthase [Fibrobacteria bacterium]|mgnify:CR=1 FL=1|nr:uroporphyrinogen-III synthase [Fibrobacteria bacterium]HOX52054.1 uroporphyrinogen-III synthase [Fibrobacteria bacterium]